MKLLCRHFILHSICSNWHPNGLQWYVLDSVWYRAVHPGVVNTLQENAGGVGYGRGAANQMSRNAKILAKLPDRRKHVVL